MPHPSPIDPLTGGKFALSGRIVCMDAARTVIPEGVVYVSAGQLVAVLPHDAPVPEGFAKKDIVGSGGTIFPGLFELHNHLSYNVLPLWQVPKHYDNRNQWGSSGEPQIYRKLVSGPMRILGRSALLAAVVRYVEVKALLGGTTTSQGIELYSNQQSRSFYRGLVRNVEQSLQPDALPHAATRIGDVTDVASFRTQLVRAKGAYILHLSEGIDPGTRKHFTGLQLPSGQWAFDNQPGESKLVGIHCVALESEDFEVMGRLGAKMVWSPLSNLLLYGQTARIVDARAHGVKVALGSDWSVSGSKNLLGELKVAHLAAPDIPLPDLVAMATCDAAAAVGWGGALGSLEAGKRADLLVVGGKTGDPYEKLLRASENDLDLVVIGGVPRVGIPRLMDHLGVTSAEELTVGGEPRRLNLAQATADERVASLGLAQATALLDDALAHLPEIAKQPDAAPPPDTETWSLGLDEDDEQIRAPRSEGRPEPRPDAGPSEPLWKVLVPLTRDPLTVVDDLQFFPTLRAQTNLPESIKLGLKALYR
jgi:5-methylthioadenosine/S-adenosylhomocysteine deaminase